MDNSIPIPAGFPDSFRLKTFSDSKLFSVRGLPKRLHLDNVYFNGLHTLIPFWLINNTNTPLDIKLSSTLDKTTLRFQRQNPNWDSVPPDARSTYIRIIDKSDITINEEQLQDKGDNRNDTDCSADDEITIVCDPSAQRDFGEIFNLLDGVDHITLEPHETAEMIMLYLAHEPKKVKATPTHSRKQSLGQTSLQGSTAGSTTVSGDAHASKTHTTANVSLSSSNEGFYSWTTTRAILEFSAMSKDIEASDSYIMRLHVTSCRSVLEMVPPTSRIYIDDCVVGRPYERAFQIKNASSIGLSWRMSEVEATHTTPSMPSLQFLDPDLKPIHGGYLAGGSHQTILIKYIPEIVGEFLCRFLIENTNDPCNQRTWVFRARASQRQKPKRIELLSEPDIDFGDCTSGIWYSRDVSFKNISDMPVIMRFRVEGNLSNLKIKSSIKMKQSGDDNNSNADNKGFDPGSQTNQQSGYVQNVNQNVIGNDNLPDWASEETRSLGTSLASGPVYEEGDIDGGILKSLHVSSEAHDEVASENGSLAALSMVSATDATDETATQGSTTALQLNSSNSSNNNNNNNNSTRRESLIAFDHSHRESNRRSGTRVRNNASHIGQPILFDEVLIKPGATRITSFSLMGNIVESDSFNAGKFVRLSFTLFCEYSEATGTTLSRINKQGAPSRTERAERMSIPCTLNMCTSFVRVSPTLLDFGNVDVGTLKSMYLHIENLSQVEAIVQCRLDSKVVNCIRTAIAIPPLQSESIRVDIYPRRINARYRKQLIVRNNVNRLNDSVVEVRSIHIDRRLMAYHNLFYKTLVPNNEQNFVDFGTVPLNSRVLRKINLNNLCRRPITIELTSSDSSSSDQPTSSSRVLTAYKVASLMRNNMISDEAYQVAQKLAMLERQAVMHSNIERFKENVNNGSLTLADFDINQNSKEKETLRSNSSSAIISHLHDRLQPDVFIDKTIECGHTCLLPFVRNGKTPLPYSSIEYLDIASRPVAKKSVIRIQKVAATESTVLFKNSSSRESVLANPSEYQLTRESSGLTSEIITIMFNWASRILNEIIDKLDTIPQTMFPSAQLEDEYVRKQVDLHKYIDLLIESGFLRIAHQVSLPALGVEPVFVMIQPSEFHFASEKQIPSRFDANLYFKLIDCPSDLLPDTPNANTTIFSSSYQLPVRRFLIQASLCRSELEIGQKSVNVGNMQVDETSRKYLLIQNRTETPLMYAIRKTGSIASGDIRFVDNNRYGVIRGYDSRKVFFVFSPSLTGIYNELIDIANVLNVRGRKTANLKAVVRRPSKFYIQSLNLNFCKGFEYKQLIDNDDNRTSDTTEAANHIFEDPQPEPLTPGQRSKEVLVLVLKNMTSKTRYFTVKPLEKEEVAFPPTTSNAEITTSTVHELHEKTTRSQSGSKPRVSLKVMFPEDEVAAIRPTKLIDRDTEEKIEGLEQKLKIAIRKNRPEKIEKYRKKLSKLRGQNVDLEPPNNPQARDSTTSSSAKSDIDKTGRSGSCQPANPISEVKRLEGDTQLLITLAGNADVSIPVVAIPQVIDDPNSCLPHVSSSKYNIAIATAHLMVHERKDQDNIKVVCVSGPVKLVK